jgi:hypothetical protein
MRIYSNVGPYSGRKPEAKAKKLGGAIMRQTSKQPNGTTPRNAPKGGIGDTKDPWLRGKSGELYEFYDRRKAKR